MVSTASLAAALVILTSGSATATPASAYTVTATIVSNPGPQGVAVDPTTHKFYVTNQNGSYLAVFSGVTNGIEGAQQIGPRPIGVAVDPTTHRIYAANNSGSSVSVMDGTDAIVATIPIRPDLAASPYAIAVDPSTHTVYVTETNYGKLYVIDGATNTITTVVDLPAPVAPFGVAVDPGTHRVYVTDLYRNLVTVVDGTTNTIVTTLGLSDGVANPYGVTVDPTTHQVYLADSLGNQITVIDGSTDTVTGHIGVGATPYAVALDPTRHVGYSANYDANTVSVFDTTSNTTIQTVSVGSHPRGVDVDPTTHKAYVINFGDEDPDFPGPIYNSTISVISAPTMAPGAPTVGTATGGNTQATVDFTAPADDGGSAITGYTVTATDTTTPGNGGQTQTGPANPITVTGLTNGDSYIFTVTATNVVGTSPPSQASNPVTPWPAPVLSSISPNSGPVAGGTAVTITGSGFRTATDVKFGSAGFATFTIDSDSQITATAPAVASAGVRNIWVDNPAGRSPVISADRYTYTSVAAAPVVTGLAPSSGRFAGGTSVVITGTGFTGASRVTFGFNGPTATFTVDSPTQITATAPAVAGAGARHVRVTTPNGISSTSASDRFTYTATPPAITGVSPSNGPLAGGTTVTITGTGFTGATKVAFGYSGPLATFTIDSDTQITATSPAVGATGARNVRVTTPNGVSAVVSADRYTYTP